MGEADDDKLEMDSDLGPSAAGAAPPDEPRASHSPSANQTTVEDDDAVMESLYEDFGLNFMNRRHLNLSLREFSLNFMNSTSKQRLNRNGRTEGDMRPPALGDTRFR